MSKTKNNKLLIPLISARESRLKPAHDSKQLKETEKKKELLMKAYDNERVMLPRRSFRKPQDSKVAVSFQDKVGSGVAMPANYRYGPPKLELNEYLQEGRLPEEGRSYIRRTSRPRPGSLFKIAEKSSVAEIRTKRNERDRSSSNIDMSQNHSVDLFKVKQSNQRRLPNQPQTAVSKTKSILDEGRRLYRDGKHDQACKYFLEVIEEEPNHLEALYFLAVIALNNKQFEKSFEYLSDILKHRTDYKKSVYLFMCIALKNLGKRAEAVLVASQGIAIFREYFDLLIYRAKLYQADQIFDLAQKDYDAALALKDDNAEAYYKKGQCYLQMKEWKRAVTSLTTAIYLDQGYKLKSLSERARAYLELQNLTEARKDIDKLIATDPGSSENFELRGMLQTKENQIGEAILSFQQCIKNNTSKSSLAIALVEITKFKIRDRDFYSAYHHICRSQFLELKSPAVEIYKLFTEGVIFLMKRKTAEGLANLNKLQQKYPQLDDFVLKLFFLYRAYGHFVSNQHEKCLEDYAEAQKHQKKDRHAIFNMLIAEGIVHSKNAMYDKAFELFNRAQALLPNKLEPYLYRSVNHVLMACETMRDDQIKKLEVVFQALKELDRAYDLNNANSNQLFLRGLIYYYLGKINEGLEDIGRAISKSEENVPKYFFYRGIGQGYTSNVYRTLKNYKQCQNDLTICINLDDNFAEAYLERSKAFFLDGHTQKAVDDIAKYAQLNPAVDRHFIEGNLYFSNSDYEEAIKRFEKGQVSRESMIMRIKCCIVMGDYRKAEEIMSELNELNQDEFVADMAILQLLQVLSRQTEKDRLAEPFNGKAMQQILETLTREPKTRSNGIFSQLHMYHYMGVCQFYLGRYSDALLEFSKAHKQRQLLNIESQLDYKDIKNMLNSEESRNEDPYSSDRDFNEINYNIFLCYIKLGEHKKAYEMFIRDVMPAKENVFQNELLSIFSRMIFQTMRKSEAPDKLPNESSIEAITDFQITLFDNVLSSGVPYTTLGLKENIVRTKLCLLVPNLKLHKMLPEVSSRQIILRINLSEVENKPEPPWVKRSEEESLIFTDDIQSIDNIEFNTEENQEDESQEDGQQEEQEEAEEYEEEEQRPEAEFDIEKIKQAMKLDDSIEQKLNKLIGRGKKPEP